MKKAFLICFVFLYGTFYLPSTVNSETSIAYVYDANGNLVQGDGKYYEYNDANKLVKVRFGDQNGQAIAEYFYDYTGQRIKKIENGVTTYYIGKHYVQEIPYSGQLKPTKYYFANSERIAKKDSSGALSYYHSDHLGGTNAVTDSSGTLLEKTNYYPFGEMLEGGNDRYTYTGKERDDLTNWYYFEARYYNTEIIHFTQADVISPDLYNPQNLNRYSYVRNNPFKYVDLLGMNAIDTLYLTYIPNLLTLAISTSVQDFFSNKYIHEKGAGENAEFAKTPQQFIEHYERKSLSEIKFSGGVMKRIGNLRVISNGPPKSYDNNSESWRFITDPKTGKVIDMRHFLTIGSKKSSEVGLAIEVFQSIFRADPGNKASAMKPQDFFSNKLGIDFFNNYYDPRNGNFTNQLNEYFKLRKNSK